VRRPVIAHESLWQTAHTVGQRTHPLPSPHPIRSGGAGARAFSGTADEHSESSIDISTSFQESEEASGSGGPSPPPAAAHGRGGGARGAAPPQVRTAASATATTSTSSSSFGRVTDFAGFSSGAGTAARSPPFVVEEDEDEDDDEDDEDDGSSFNGESGDYAESEFRSAPPSANRAGGGGGAGNNTTTEYSYSESEGGGLATPASRGSRGGGAAHSHSRSQHNRSHGQARSAGRGSFAGDSSRTSQQDFSPREGTSSGSSSSSSSSAAGLKPGLRVLCRYGGGGEWYAGTLARENSDGTWVVNYDDGDSEEAAPLYRIRPVAVSPSGAGSASRSGEEAEDGDGDGEVDADGRGASAVTPVTSVTPGKFGRVIMFAGAEGGGGGEGGAAAAAAAATAAGAGGTSPRSSSAYPLQQRQRQQPVGSPLYSVEEDAIPDETERGAGADAGSAGAPSSSSRPAPGLGSPSVKLGALSRPIVHSTGLTSADTEYSGDGFEGDASGDAGASPRETSPASAATPARGTAAVLSATMAGDGQQQYSMVFDTTLAPGAAAGLPASSPLGRSPAARGGRVAPGSSPVPHRLSGTAPGSSPAGASQPRRAVYPQHEIGIQTDGPTSSSSSYNPYAYPPPPPPPPHYYSHVHGYGVPPGGMAAYPPAVPVPTMPVLQPLGLGNSALSAILAGLRPGGAGLVAAGRVAPPPVPPAPPAAPSASSPTTVYLRALADALARPPGSVPSAAAAAAGATATSAAASLSPSAAAAAAGLHPSVVGALANYQATLAASDLAFARQVQLLRAHVSRTRSMLASANGTRPSGGGSPGGQGHESSSGAKGGYAYSTLAEAQEYIAEQRAKRPPLTFEEALRRVQQEG
jgi:hypothetical protein